MRNRILLVCVLALTGCTRVFQCQQVKGAERWAFAGASVERCRLSLSQAPEDLARTEFVSHGMWPLSRVYRVDGRRQLIKNRAQVIAGKSVRSARVAVGLALLGEDFHEIPGLYRAEALLADDSRATWTVSLDEGLTLQVDRTPDGFRVLAPVNPIFDCDSSVVEREFLVSSQGIVRMTAHAKVIRPATGIQVCAD